MRSTSGVNSLYRLRKTKEIPDFPPKNQELAAKNCGCLPALSTGKRQLVVALLSDFVVTKLYHGLQDLNTAGSPVLLFVFCRIDVLCQDEESFFFIHVR